MLTGQEVSRTCPSHNVLEMLLLLQLLFKEPFAAVLTAEGTSRYWRQMVFFPLLTVQFPILSLPFGKQLEVSGQGSMENVVFRLLPCLMEASA